MKASLRWSSGLPMLVAIKICSLSKEGQMIFQETVSIK